MNVLVISVAIAFLVGMLVDHGLSKLEKAYGVLRIDRSNLEKDTYRFEIDNLEVLSKKKFIILRVDNNADLSQK